MTILIMRLSKNKFFICVLLLSVTVYFMWAPTARAGDIVFAPLEAIGDFISSQVEVILIAMTVFIVVAVLQQYELLPAIIATSTTSGAVLTTAAGDMIALTVAEAASITLGAGETLLTFYSATFITAEGIAAGLTAVGTATLSTMLPSGEREAILISVDSVQDQCQFQNPVTFYIPSFNQGYVTGPDQYCYYDVSGEQICEPMPASTQKYQPLTEPNPDGPGNIVVDACYTPDSNGAYAMFNGSCVPVTPGITTWQAIDETQNKIALYRIAAPVDQFKNSTGGINNSALAQWYMGIYDRMGTSGHKLGDGLVYWSPGGEKYDNYTMIYQNKPAENLIGVVNYSDVCTGNVCRIIDSVEIPENSYVFYAAKIVGDYLWTVIEDPNCSVDDTFCSEGKTIIYHVPAKFLSTQDPPIQGSLAMVPWIMADRYTMGDAFSIPIQTGSLDCPETVVNYALSVSKVGTGTGTIVSSPGVINCGGVCSSTFISGTDVTLTAAPNSNSVFYGWSGGSGACSGTSPACVVKMDGDKIAAATFIPKTLNLSLSATPMARERYFSYSWPYGWRTRFKSTVTAAVDGTARGQVKYVYNCGGGQMGAIFSTPVPPEAPDSKSFNCTYYSSSPVTVNVDATRDGLTVGKNLVLSSQPSLTVNFSASPSLSYEPVTSAITAQAGGTAQGSIDYYFDCGTVYDPFNYSVIKSEKRNSQSTSESVNCRYNYVGVYTPKVKVVRNGITVEKSATVILLNPPPVTAYCGSAANQTFSSPPTNNLCNPGTPSPVTTNDTTYNWTCYGSGGGLSAQCLAGKTPTVDLKVNFSNGPITTGYAPTDLTITWDTTNKPQIQDCAGTGYNWSGTKQKAGSDSLAGVPAGDYEYEIGCNTVGNQWGQIKDKVVVYVPPPPNSAPSVSSPSVSSVSSAVYCDIPAHTLSWVYSDSDGDAESKFQLQIASNPQKDVNGNFLNPEVNRIESGLNLPNGTRNEQKVLVALAAAADKLTYNTLYNWQIKVWDSKGAASLWIAGPSFRTADHQYPTADFSWAPLAPSVNETVQLADQSKCFNDSQLQVPCSGPWSWTIPDTNGPSSRTEQNPSVKFTSNGNKNVIFSVTDSDGYRCSTSELVRVRQPLPGWKEIAP